MRVDPSQRSGRASALLRGLALAFVYLLVVQTTLAPLATLRMDPSASIFGVRCLPMSGGATQDDPAAHGACCDASCLLQSQGASAPPPDVAVAAAPPLRFARTSQTVFAHEDAPRLSRGLRPQSQRAPPFA